MRSHNPRRRQRNQTLKCEQYPNRLTLFKMFYKALESWGRRRYEPEQGGNLVILLTLNPDSLPKLNYIISKIVLRKEALRI